MDYPRCGKVFENLRVMNMTQTPTFFFSRTNPEKNNFNSSLLHYSKRSQMVVSVDISTAFGLNIPLRSFDAFLAVWVMIMINVVVIFSYMTFIIPKASKAFATWLNSATVKEVC